MGGLQHKSVEDLEKDLELPSSQILGLFNRIIRKVVQFFSTIKEKDVEQTMVARKEIDMAPVKQTMDEELDEAAKKEVAKQQRQKDVLSTHELGQFSIQGSEKDWEDALKTGSKGLVSVKGLQKKGKSEPTNGT